MSVRRSSGLLAVAFAVIATAVAAQTSPAPGTGNMGTGSMGGMKMGDAGGGDFESAMQKAMAQMDKDMNASMTGDPDKDFARMMIPHHQGAIDMAEAELRFGKDQRLLKLAREIIAAQKREIATMRAELATLEAKK